MLCLACAAELGRPLCLRCRGDLREGPQFVLDGRILVGAAFHHHGAARRLVHRLKYDGLVEAGKLLAAAMVPRLPRTATALVPIPRAVTRRIRHGIDPAAFLAAELSRLTQIPTDHSLRPALWWPRHATRPRGRRSAVHFRLARAALRGAVLIDDVVTTGATVVAAQRATGGLVHAIAATSPGAPQPALVEEGGKAHDAHDRSRVE